MKVIYKLPEVVQCVFTNYSCETDVDFLTWGKAET